MKIRRILIALAMGASLIACGESERKLSPEEVCPGPGADAGKETHSNSCSDFKDTICLEFGPSEEEVDALFTALNTLDEEKPTTIVLGEGRFELSQGINVQAGVGLNIVGQGIDKTILDFAEAGQVHGILYKGKDFLVQDLTVTNTDLDAIRVEDTDGVVYRRVKTTWDAGPLSTNGAYGIYPVKSTNVLIEDSIAENASDAGLYVGQSRNVIVRRNLVRANVAGLEIENTQFADVYHNLAEDNTAGIVVFDLPGNPVFGRDILLRENCIRENNRENFAPGGIVQEIPPGTGTFALASRRVEIRDNVYRDNNLVTIALLSGLDVDPREKWAVKKEDVIGKIDDLNLEEDENNYYNYRTEEIFVHNNTVENESIVREEPPSQELGLMLHLLYDSGETDHVIYDGTEEELDYIEPSKSSNKHRICVDNQTTASLGVLGIRISESGSVIPPSDVARFLAPNSFAPYDCDGFTGGALVVPSKIPSDFPN